MSPGRPSRDSISPHRQRLSSRHRRQRWRHIPLVPLKPRGPLAAVVPLVDTNCTAVGAGPSIRADSRIASQCGGGRNLPSVLIAWLASVSTDDASRRSALARQIALPVAQSCACLFDRRLVSADLVPPSAT